MGGFLITSGEEWVLVAAKEREGREIRSKVSMGGPRTRPSLRSTGEGDTTVPPVLLSSGSE